MMETAKRTKETASKQTEKTARKKRASYTRKPRPLTVGLEVFTTQQAAEYYNVSARTIYRAIKSGKLKAYKLAKDLRIKRDDLRRWFEGLAVTDQDREEMDA
jgi:excisionase family DNA binding protein